MTPPHTEPVLPAAELKPGHTELWHRYHATGPGDQSEEELVIQYLPLVKTMIGRLAMNLPAHVETEELYSAGMVGLLNAVRQYNPKVGVPFEAYARLRIRGAVIDELRRMDWAPRSLHAKARKVQVAMDALEQRHGRLPNDEEVAAALNLTMTEYDRLLDEIRPVTFLCLDSVALEDGEEESSPHEVICDPTEEDACGAASRADLARLIAERIRTLPDLHRKVVALYYFEDLRLREIAAVCGLCESRICQIHTQAILAIRSYVESCEAASQIPLRDFSS